MLNPTAPLANGPMTAVAPPGPAQTGNEDGRAFAQALDQAASSQRDAVSDTAQARGGDDSHPKTKAPGRPRPEATEARPAPTSRGNATREATVAENATVVVTDSAGALPGDTQPPRDSAEDSYTSPQANEAEPSPPDLAAWVSTLPLLRPAPAVVAAAATPAATAATGAEAALGAAAAASSAEDRAAAVTARLSQTTALAAPAEEPATTTPDFATMLATTPTRHDTRNARAPQPAQVDAAAAGKEAASGKADAVLQALGLQREGPAAQRAAGEPVPALAATAAGWPGALPRLADSAAPTKAEVQAPVGSHEFAPALGSQLSVMVRDGIDHAQLKLNPAEMGPIEVRISLDGTQAQVDFSAAHAATRQALQDAVPALASALRENGLTLTGGGVFEQAREQRGDARQDGSGPPAGGSRTPLDGAAAPLPATRSPRARGVVDLYA
jgi:flagellar hook-length control protein FliK